MKISVMQPYFFPYLGYYQMVEKVDEFVFLDDVNYFKKGYINRNAIALNGLPHNFTISINKSSQNKKILELFYTDNLSKFFKLIDSAYKKAKYYESGKALIEKAFEEGKGNVALTNASSIKLVFEYIGLKKEFSCSSSLLLGDEFKGQSRILETCKQKKAQVYINAMGGKALYDSESFSREKVDLNFFQPQIEHYEQLEHGFLENLSMIDCLMNLSPNEIKELIMLGGI
ncbi:WbqC family protein [Vibrio cyclitrophicus]